MKFVKYQFPEEKSFSHGEGYVYIVVVEGEAMLDPDDADLLKLAQKLGGKPVTEKRSSKKAQVSK
jgi:hypothetical protein